MKEIKQKFLILVILLFSLSPLLPAQTAELYEEKYRPQYHYTPEKYWMNDPNGLVYYNKEYHLFYQYNPFGNKWGHMSWGHAVSSDLVHWKNLKVAIPEADGIMIYSGCAVIDWNNTSGFGKNGLTPMVAVYTGRRNSDDNQSQCLAYSTDDGRTWTKYKDNPVIDIHSNNFRDPNVFMYAPEKKWVMTVALSAEHKIRFYSSKDLKHWQLMSEFGPAGAARGVWECPDLFPLKVDGNKKDVKWVLNVNIGTGSAAGGSGDQYFIGDFDGTKFTADDFQAADNNVKKIIPEGTVIADFEGNNYVNWKVIGEAFANSPAKGSLKNQGHVAGYIGKGLVNSFNNGDSSEGALVSPAFRIKDNYISFLIGGGHHPGKCAINLIIDGKTAESSTGSNSEELSWDSWNVHPYISKTAVIEIKDSAIGGWGHICIDQIMQTPEKVLAKEVKTHWADYGKDFYAAVTYSDIPAADGRRIWIGWMSNWEYAQDIPTTPWKNAMTIPRVLSLKSFKDGIRLVQNPITELKKLRMKKFDYKNITSAEANNLFGTGVMNGKQLELKVEIEVGNVENLGFEVRKGKNEKTVIGYFPKKKELYIDRRKSGETKFNDQFAGIQRAPMAPVDGIITLHIFVDCSSVEVFGNNGRVVLTDLIFPSPSSRGLAFFSKGSGMKIKKLEVWKLRSIWN